MARKDSTSFANFPTSDWSRWDPAASLEMRRKVIERLGRLYWKPICTFIRLRGVPYEDARDLTQECFVRLTSGEGLPAFEGRSRLRNFLRAIAEHVIVDHRKAAGRVKRGGRQSIRVFSDERMKDVVADEAAKPEDAYDRSWSLVVQEQALALLLKELGGANEERRRRIIEIYLLPRVRQEPNAPTQDDVAKQLGCTRKIVEHDLTAIRALAQPLLYQVINDTVASRREGGSGEDLWDTPPPAFAPDHLIQLKKLLSGESVTPAYEGAVETISGLGK